MKIFIFNPDKLELVEKRDKKPIVYFVANIPPIKYTCHPSCKEVWKGKTYIREDEFKLSDGKDWNNLCVEEKIAYPK